MTLDTTKPVQTRDGRPVRIIGWRVGSTRYPIVGLIDGDDVVSCWMEDGEFAEHVPEHPEDLVNVPERKSLYMSFYKEGRMACWPSRVAADAHKTNRIVLIRVDIEDGVIVGFEREL